MNHKYIILTAMYHYKLLNLASNSSATQLRHVLTTTNPYSMVFGAKRMMKKALKENYEIRNRQEMQQEINNYAWTIYEDCAVYGLLIELYLVDPTKFIDTTPEMAYAFFAAQVEADQKHALRLIWKALQPSDAQDVYIQNTIKNATDFFESTSHDARELYELFQQNHTWLLQTKGMSFAGFQLSRIISILADSTMCGYLSDDDARKAMDYYGAVAEQLFHDWESFLFSAVLGKMMMSNASGQFIIDAADYVTSCSALAAHPAKLLELSGVWVGSDTTLFVHSCANYFKGEEGTYDTSRQ